MRIGTLGYQTGFKTRPAQATPQKRPVASASVASSTEKPASAVHFQGYFQLGRKMRWLGQARSENPQIQMGLLDEMRDYDLTHKEAELQIPIYQALARHGNDQVKQALLDEIGTWREGIDDLAPVLVVLAETGNQDLKKAVVEELGHWDSITAAQAAVLCAVAQHGDREAHQAVLDELPRWEVLFDEQAQVLRTLALYGDRTIQLGVMNELGTWTQTSADQADIMTILAERGDTPVLQAVLEDLSCWDAFSLEQADVLYTLAARQEPEIYGLLLEELQRWPSWRRSQIAEPWEILGAAYQAPRQPSFTDKLTEAYQLTGLDRVNPPSEPEFKKVRRRWNIQLHPDWPHNGPAEEKRLKDINSALDRIAESLGYP